MASKIWIKIKENKWLLLIMLLGAFLRIFYLGHESFWLDESETVFATQKTPSYIVQNMFAKTLAPEIFGPERGGGSMPLPYILFYYWTKLVGMNEFNLRLLSAIFGIASIYLIYVLGKVFFNKKIGLISAFILAINHQHIYYSQEARVYSFLVMSAMLSVYFLYKLLFLGKSYHIVFYFISTVAMLYSHYYSIFFLIFEIVYVLFVLIYHKSNLRQALVSLLLIILAYLPWLPAFFRQISQGAVSRIQGPLTLSKIAQTAIGINSWISLDFGTRSALVNLRLVGITISGFLTIASVLLISLIFISLFLKEIILFIKYFKDSTSIDKGASKYLILIMWIFIPLLMLLALAVISPETSTFGPIRYLLFLTPPYYILISKSIVNFKGIFRKLDKLGVKYIVILIVLLSTMPIYSYYTNYDKGQYREAAEYLASKVKETDLVIVHGAPTFYPFNFYYNQYPKRALVYKSFSIEDLNKFVASRNEFWAVQSMLKHYDPKNEFLNYVDNSFVAEEKAEFIDVKVVKYKRKNLSSNK